MKIVVCVKQIPNPEAAFSMLTVDEQAKKVLPSPGLPLVMSPFDEQAVEAALRIREKGAQANVIALSIGPDSARNTLKHALAMGADEALLVSGSELADCTGEAIAFVLATAIRQLGQVDLVLTGRQAADWDAGIVGCALGELLGWPVVTFGRSVEAAPLHVRVERVLADGFETIEAELPAVVTISNEIGPARAPSLRETMRAARKPLTVRCAADMGLDAAGIAAMAARRVRERLFEPVRENQCELIPGPDERAQAATLARRLREARLV
ncbi:MAG: electron transfer flavoprotein subunit beta/FixA family protein [Burkholderiales bacterium]